MKTKDNIPNTTVGLLPNLKDYCINSSDRLFNSTFKMLIKTLWP